MKSLYSAALNMMTVGNPNRFYVDKICTENSNKNEHNNL